ncbi:non-homologous end-joining DNA ligase [Actinocorallia sp. API 0066]|uniref:non-homologous end-joining DNA ligase n=1 Tax=Actinocorallia sp. API 0066 TaxID=2896846 RepID=UPI001E421119|nr:non-homologous end-joining DNA ligase [Actinocorallia sp. API 0066]MCD0448071.1 non-homologous end-joining DNA ligase [Actinocorallia sp. API 0066]
MDVLEPMLATPGELPDDLDHWALELKWDGVRALAHVTPGRVLVYGRRGTPITATYPELGVLADLLLGHEAILDGEIVAFDDGKPSFAKLQRRMHVRAPTQALLRAVPIRYVVFDLLRLDETSLLDLPYVERRKALEGLELAAGPVEVPPHLPAEDRDQVAELLAYTAEENLEGLVAKRLDSRYTPGRRSTAWRKVKNVRTQEVVIVGWRPGQGRRHGAVGSLLCGVHIDGELRYVGHVGTGFTDAFLDDLALLLKPLERSKTPCQGEIPRAVTLEAHWVEPLIVGEVAFGEWTGDGRLRHPSWRGLRSDKNPEEVVLE